MDEPNDDEHIQQVQDQIIGEQNNFQYDSDDEQQLPQFANDSNKKLQELVREKKKVIKKINKQIQQSIQRKKNLQKHLISVQQDLLNLKTLIDNKNKQTQTQNHLWQITQRQCGRVQTQVKKYNKIMLDNSQRLNDIQVRIFRTSQKVQQIKLQLNWNQQQLQQWAITGKQKQQDNVTLQKYHKEDVSKIRQLNLQIQKLTTQVNRKQQQLDIQITQTQTIQIQLDKTSQQFKKQHDQRHKLFQKWQQVTKIISKRTQDLINIARDTENIMENINKNKQIQDQRIKQLQNQKKLNRQQQVKTVIANRQISDKKNQNKLMEFQKISNLAAQVQILKNQLSSFGGQLASKRRKVDLLNKDLLNKKQRLMNEQQKYKANNIKLKNQLKLAQKFGVAKVNAQQNYKQKQVQRKKIQQQISQKKDALVKSTQQLFKFRQDESNLFIQIQGIMATCSNLQSHINKLNQDFQKQQQLLYNASYQIQLMQRKVARAKGQRTLQQKKDLQKDVDQATKKNTDMKSQYKILNDSVKKLDQDLRTVKSNLVQIKTGQKKLNSHIQQLSLQNDMTLQDLNRITKKKQQVLVQHDIMKLQIKKINNFLGRATDNVYTLQNKKNQLEMSMQQRQKQIQVHRDVLLAQHKAIEDQRHKIAIQLAQRKNKVKNLKIKFQSLVQKAHGSEGGDSEHSQAYYVIKAAQQKEELQRKGDELGAKIIEAQKKLKSLQNYLVSIQNINTRTKVQLSNKGVTKSQLAQKNSLQQQVNAASLNLTKRKKQIQKLDQEYEQDLKRLTQVQNKYQNLKQRKNKLQQIMYKMRQDLKQNQQKSTRAQKSLTIIKNNLLKNKKQMKQDSQHMLQLHYDVQTDKNKTLISTLINLGQQLPQLGPLIQDALRQNNVQIQSKAPSSVDPGSSRGSMSVKSGGSAISRSSKMSKKVHDYLQHSITQSSNTNTYKKQKK